MLNQVILALDKPTLSSALALVDQLPMVEWWKVGLQLFTAVGSPILQELQQRQKRIFLDLKLHDIPNTVAMATEAVAEQGVDLLTLHALGGSVMMQAAVEAAAGSPCRLLAVTVLTSLSEVALHQELKVETALPDYTLHLARLAQQQGIAGSVCSPLEVAALRQACGSDFLLVTPGIRSSDAVADDQVRVLSAQAALAAGSDFVVVGRAVTSAPDPALALQRLCQEADD